MTKTIVRDGITLSIEGLCAVEGCLRPLAHIGHGFTELCCYHYAPHLPTADCRAAGQ